MPIHTKAKIGVGFGMGQLTAFGLAKIYNFAAVFAHLDFQSMFTRARYCLIQRAIG
jgi:hypothetical protein